MFSSSAICKMCKIVRQTELFSFGPTIGRGEGTLRIHSSCSLVLLPSLVIGAQLT